jgi:16S rRNA A1518/A1519 N6-dimethyltransferase RsmA/KsgA/DIM1 with predicted DNA glycosylase/AP lyase activity
MYATEVLEPTVDQPATLAGDGPALELAIGTGRVALPLMQRGIEVHGMELSPNMVDQLRKKPGGEELPVTIGDMTSCTAAGEFKLVYLVWNDLVPGGRFVVEVIVPQLESS